MGVSLVPDDETAINDLLRDDFCSRISVSLASISNAAASAKTALCLIGDSSDYLWPRTADTFAYVLLQSSQTASEQLRYKLLQDAIKYWTKPHLNPDELFRLAVAENAVGNARNYEEHMREVILKQYVPSHEFARLRKDTSI